MKKLIAISSLLALVLAGSGLFAVDIPVGDGGGKFTLDFSALYEFNIITDDSKPDGKDKSWIQEDDADRQAKVSIAASYDGDNYAFGVEGGLRKNFARDAGEFYVDSAWGKYYFLEKQLWLRGGGLDSLWRLAIEPIKYDFVGDAGPGVQLNFAPSAVTGLNVGVALPVPKAGTRDDTIQGNWGPTYPIMNAVFGLRLNGTIPNLDVGTEFGLKGNASTNGKPATDPDEGEGDFQGMGWHLTAKYTFAPVTLTAAVVVGPFGSAISGAPDPITEFGVRVLFDIPNGEGSSLDLGDPWVQFQMLKNENGAPVKSFKDMLVDFEWEPKYSISKQVTALFWIGAFYRIWADPTDPQKKYPVEVAVRPKLEFKFDPNATLAIFDKITFVRKVTEKGLKNDVGFLFSWKF